MAHRNRRRAPAGQPSTVAPRPTSRAVGTSSTRSSSSVAAAQRALRASSRSTRPRSARRSAGCGCGTTRRRPTRSRDALRLAAGMTYKAAAAGLDLGGGKGVICAPAGGLDGRASGARLLLDFGDLVESLDGRYITAEDVGTSPGRHGGDQRAHRARHRAARRSRRLRRPEPVHGDRRRGGDARLRRAQRFGAPRSRRAPRRASSDSATSGASWRGGCADGGASSPSPTSTRASASWPSELGADLARARRGDRSPSATCSRPCALGGAIDADERRALRCEIVCGCGQQPARR